ncbi:MAG: hydroxypyruvate isomerase [Planctomycetes bacterium SM23_25]|nr:MAG: hydroxypyruvate isomerase [Planctomycetes bacterium SM23_25]
MDHRADEGRSGVSRRRLLKGVAGGAAAMAAIGMTGGQARTEAAMAGAKLKGRIKQSVSRWCFGKVPMDELCKACVEMGIKGIDLVGPKEWPTMKKYGLVGTCTPGSIGIGKGLNDKANHEKALARLREAIEATAEAGFPNVICMSGNRGNISDEEGQANCVEALKQVAGLAEKKGVTVVMELLNSKVDHKDYHGDHTAWIVDVSKKVGSPRVKVLYDIYHMQIMEGDLIRTIRDNIDHIAHFHTGGNPGRNEIDETQEIYYPAVMKAIAETGFTGWVAHEFVPKRTPPLDSLRQAVRICDV